VSLGMAGAVLAPAVASAATTGLVRTDQAGYLPQDTKIAYLMASGSLSGETYKVLSSSDEKVRERLVHDLYRPRCRVRGRRAFLAVQ
ncbi:MAG TPA: cellulase N-terminal Ig-like domain-containing protein, partial [Pseudonocardiaceae bacterium]|nr:cellulase N-terminal Ig-like domain-containing protein [Pseudonocardiaceae bacterium]